MFHFMTYCLSYCWILCAIMLTCLARCAHCCGIGMAVMRLSNCFLIVFEAGSTVEILCLACKPDQQFMTRTIIGPRLKLRLLLYSHGVKLPLKIFMFLPIELFCIQLGQRGFFLQGITVNAETYLSKMPSICNYACSSGDE